MTSKPNEEMEILEGDHRVSAEQAGYLELPGAVKEGGCSKVEVEGGVSRFRGCCNLFGYRAGAAKRFSCGTCEYYVNPSDTMDAEEKS